MSITGAHTTWLSLGMTLCILAALAPNAVRAAPGETQAQIELVVLGPADPVFSRFGHVALRVNHGPGHDLAYNFGLTNFNRPNYIIDFLSGRVEFWGKAKPYDWVLKRATSTDRSVTRLPLRLNGDQKRDLEKRLQHLVRPENRNYIYDTFRNNCSTRVRDILDQICRGALSREMVGRATGLSYHDDVRTGFANLYGILLALEIFPGVTMDEPRDEWDMAFSPLRLAQSLRQIEIERDGQRIHLLGPPLVERKRLGPDPLRGWPDCAFYLLLAIAIGLAGWAALAGRMGRRTRAALLVVWLLLAGILGIALEFVQLWTDWPDMRSNWLLLGFVSLDLWLLGPGFKMIRGIRPSQKQLSLGRAYLIARLAILGPVVILGPLFSPFLGNPAPRIMALAGLLMCLRTFQLEIKSSP